MFTLNNDLFRGIFFVNKIDPRAMVQLCCFFNSLINLSVTSIIAPKYYNVLTCSISIRSISIFVSTSSSHTTITLALLLFIIIPLPFSVHPTPLLCRRDLWIIYLLCDIEIATPKRSRNFLSKPSRNV